MGFVHAEQSDYIGFDLLSTLNVKVKNLHLTNVSCAESEIKQMK